MLTAQVYSVGAQKKNVKSNVYDGGLTCAFSQGSLGVLKRHYRDHRYLNWEFVILVNWD